MIMLRSAAFNIAFYVNMVAWMILALPVLALPRPVILAVIRLWARSNNLLLRLIAGVRVEVRGAENLPNGGFIIASKHQSVWETFALFAAFPDPSFVLKRELMWIPFFGWYAKRADMIPVNRGARSAALRSMAKDAAHHVALGRQILIFPEGTRRPPGAPPAYKYGIVHLYAELGVPCVPVALNSGVFWPRRRFIRRPGTIIVEILASIPPGLDKSVFLERLQHDVEGASTRLLEAAIAETGYDPRSEAQEP